MVRRWRLIGYFSILYNTPSSILFSLSLSLSLSLCVSLSRTPQSPLSSLSAAERRRRRAASRRHRRHPHAPRREPGAHRPKREGEGETRRGGQEGAARDPSMSSRGCAERDIPHRAAGRALVAWVAFGSSCAAGFDRCWRSSGRHSKLGDLDRAQASIAFRNRHWQSPGRYHKQPASGLLFFFVRRQSAVVHGRGGPWTFKPSDAKVANRTIRGWHGGEGGDRKRLYESAWWRGSDD
jgi:hypothetical protein